MVHHEIKIMLLNHTDVLSTYTLILLILLTVFTQVRQKNIIKAVINT